MPRNRNYICLLIIQFVFLSAIHASKPNTCESLADRKENYLLITNRKVLDNYRSVGNGAWSIGHLLENLYQYPDWTTAGEEVERWLNHGFLRAYNYSDELIQPQALFYDLVLSKWPRRPNYSLDLEKSPFYLTAIVNRVDSLADGEVGGARFVFTFAHFINSENGVDNRQAGRFTIAIEYALPKELDGVPMTREAWSKKWLKLSEFEIGSEPYLQELEKLTESIVLSKSSLAQIRTNFGLYWTSIRNSKTLPRLEDVMSDGSSHSSFIWDFREFKLSDNVYSNLSYLSPMINTPKMAYKDSISTWIQENIDDILNNSFVLPPHLRANHSMVSERPGKLWASDLADKPGQLGAAYKRFNMATCVGCHSECRACHDGFFDLSQFHLIRRRTSAPGPGETSVSPFLKNDLERRRQVSIALACTKGGHSNANAKGSNNAKLWKFAH